MVFAEFAKEVYEAVISSVPEKYGLFVILGFYTIIITIYSIFIWKFYKFLARRDILELNLRQYNRTTHPALYKLVAVLLFFIEYLIILPILVFFWFSVLSVFLLLLSSKTQEVADILLISASIVAAVRMTSYISQDLSIDLAKIFPFTVLGVFLINPDFFFVEVFIERISKIPSMLSHIFSYLVFIIILEFFIRMVFVLFELTWSRKSEE